MEEALKFIAAGGSVTTLLLIYYVWKIEPRLRSMEITQLQGQQVALLKLTEQLMHLPDACNNAKQLLQATEIKLNELTK